jgi:hypothetical protein
VHSIFGTLGPAGLAAVLTALLWLGTAGGGKVKSLSWGWCLILGSVAGAAYKAAGAPFSLVSDGVNDATSLAGATIHGLTMPALALLQIVVILYKKLTPRAVAMNGIVFWYLASGAGGAPGILADRIHLIAQHLAS